MYVFTCPIKWPRKVSNETCLFTQTLSSYGLDLVEARMNKQILCVVLHFVGKWLAFGRYSV
jgi:hypothetical protein